MFGGVYQDIAKEPDPAKQAAMHQSVMSLHPELKNRIESHGIDSSNPSAVGGFFTGIAHGYQNPLDVAKIKAETELARAHAGFFGAESRMKDPVYLGKMIDGMFAGSGAQGAQGATQGQPSNALSSPQGQPPQQAQPMQNGGLSPYTPGQTTASNTGDVPAQYGRGTTPDPADNTNTKRALKMAMVSRALGMEYDKLPEVVQESARAKARGTRMDAMEEGQQKALEAEGTMNRIEDIIKGTPPAVISHVIGTNYVNNNDAVQGLRAQFGGDWEKAYNTRQELMHNIELLASGQAGRTDQQQSIIKDAVGQFMKTTKPNSAMSILYDAKNGLRRNANLPTINKPDYALNDNELAARNPGGASPSSPRGAPGAPTAPAIDPSKIGVGGKFNSPVLGPQVRGPDGLWYPDTGAR